MLVEVCANSLESALNAEKAGADRIELCVELGVGGLTPSFGLLNAVREKVKIPVHVLIRPRSGDFLYSDYEFEVMLKDVENCVNIGVEGIVSGVLMSDFTIDIARMKQLVNASKNLKFTFHRAFDWVKDPFIALNQLEHLKVDYILTSGQRKKAVDGIELLEALDEKTVNCTIMPGSGIKPENAMIFKDANFKIIHLSAAVAHLKKANIKEIPMNYPLFLDEENNVVSDPKIIEGVVNRVK